MPESVRWLLANGKGAEAKEIIQEAARTNKVSIPDFIMDRVDMEATKQEKKVAVTKSASLGGGLVLGEGRGGKFSGMGRPANETGLVA